MNSSQHQHWKLSHASWELWCYPHISEYHKMVICGSLIVEVSIEFSMVHSKSKSMKGSYSKIVHLPVVYCMINVLFTSKTYCSWNNVLITQQSFMRTSRVEVLLMWETVFLQLWAIKFQQFGHNLTGLDSWKSIKEGEGEGGLSLFAFY